MRGLCGVLLLVVGLIGLSHAATTYELDAKKFIDEASKRYYKIYDSIAEQTYTSSDDDDFEVIFSKINTVKEIASELVSISKEAAEYDLSKIQDDQIKTALQKLRKVGDLFVLGEDYFSSVLINIIALKELSTDKDIEPYRGGTNMPNQTDTPLSLDPDIQGIFQHSNSSDELKYYWEAWREKNSVWAFINFENIVEAFKKASNMMEIPVVEFWFRFYNNKDFLQEMEKVMDDIKPAYQQLHAFVRQQLHKKYGAEVIDLNGPIPAHLFEQVLEQVWQEGSVIEEYFPFKELPPYNDFVENFEAKQAIDEAARFYKSLGFEELSTEFQQNQLRESDVVEDVGDCRADIFDMTPHVYLLYCKKVDFRKFLQNHGYLSRVYYAQQKKDLPAYYFDSYDLEYPVGEAVILSASTPTHLASIGLAKNFNFTDKTLMNRLFRMGLHTILNIPLFFVHSKVMTDLLNGVVDVYGTNKHYWKLMNEYVGVEPPSDRQEELFDFPYKFYLDMEENYQTKKFVSEVLGYQFYRAFCRKSLQAGPLHNCDFYGNLAVGNDLKAMMSLGSSKPWRDVIAKLLPDSPKLSGDALLEYYAPILDWVKAKNEESKAKIGWAASKKKVL